MILNQVTNIWQKPRHSFGFSHYWVVENNPSQLFHSEAFEMMIPRLYTTTLMAVAFYLNVGTVNAQQISTLASTAG